MLGKLIVGGIIGGTVVAAGMVARAVVLELADNNPKEPQNWEDEDFKQAIPGAVNRLKEDGVGHFKAILDGLKAHTGPFIGDVLLHGADEQVAKEQGR